MFNFTEILIEYAKVVKAIDNALVNESYLSAATDLQKSLGDDYTVDYSPDNNEISIIGTHDYDFQFDIKKYKDIHRVSEAVTVTLYEDHEAIAPYVLIENLEEKINIHNCRYRFMTISELANKIIERYNDEDEIRKSHPIDFTFDDERTIGFNGEPCGWCGIQITTIFDNETIAFGRYGIDICSSFAIHEDITPEDVTEDLVFLFNRYDLSDSEVNNITKDTIICVDKNTL